MGKNIGRAVLLTNRSEDVYLIKGANWVHERHLNQIKKRYIEEENNNEEPMVVFFNVFDIPVPKRAPETRQISKRKWRPSDRLKVNPKWKKYDYEGS